MAGVKGKSGGSRPNTGGKRPGAGRKPKPKGAAKSSNGRAAVPAVSTTLEPQPHGGALKRSAAVAPEVGAVAGQNPLDFLLSVQNNPQAPLKDRIRSAVAAAQYVHTKRHDGGKKDETADAAKKASSKFKPSAPPLKLVNRS